jgi:hypothetical protein
MPGFCSGARELGEIVVDQLRARGPTTSGLSMLIRDAATAPICTPASRTTWMASTTPRLASAPTSYAQSGASSAR